MYIYTLYFKQIAMASSDGIQNRSLIDPPNGNTPPLLSWDFAQQGFRNLVAKGRREQDAKILSEFAGKWGWSADLHALLELPYQALVLTDGQQQISWVNPGFSEMTGYPSNEALGRTPHFLQGGGTSRQSRKRIGQHLRKHLTVEETIVNYRKDGQAYKCQVKIIPLYNHRNTVTHYLALEREVA